MTSAKESSAVHRLIQRVHNDERGAVTIETILIIGAIALPILIFVLRFGWPRIRDQFFEGVEDMQSLSDDVSQGA